MTDINEVILIGRATRDVGSKDFAYTTGGTARLNITLAINESVKTGGNWEDRGNFFDVTVWGKTAESIKPYITKGKQIAIQGHLQQQRWEKDGNKFSKVVVIAESVHLLGGNDSEKVSNAKANQGENDGGYEDQASFDYQEDIPF
ncbi:single-stranded DNA-binding protein [Treponema pectinovorum]|uniref:single-stranded DNA-binding protein n=1 Tax=Treponema pectinovorum TaxID=164 RepID=UPI0011C9D9BC|nr:single-stranded DNA-binding protein [Treponema pectinovorum]